jgi:hypothetical protein
MNDEDLKIVLNVREPKLVALLEEIKDNTGINYQNTIKFGLLLMFQDEIKKIKSFRAQQAKEANQLNSKKKAIEKEKEVIEPAKIGAPGLVKEDLGSLLKVHITFVGKLRDAIETWKYRTGQSYQDISRSGLDKVFSFFNESAPKQEVTTTNEEVEKIKLSDFLNKKNTLTGFLND